MAVAGSLVVELSANVARLSRDMGQARSVVQSAAGQMQRSFASVASSIKAIGGAVGGLAVGAGLKSMTTAIVDAGIKAQQLENAFKAISGAGAAREIKFLKDESERLGVEFLSTADSYKRMAAAAKGTALEGDGVRKIFTAITESATVMGLSADQTAGALLAVSQMMSKGKVTAEEWNQQLAERLPQANEAARIATGKTTQEFFKMMEQGQLLAEDFLPKFSKALSGMNSGAVAGAASAAQAEINRFTNAMTDLKTEVANGLLPVFTDLTKALTAVIQKAKEGGDAIRALEGVHSVGIDVQITTNAQQANAEIQSFLQQNGIGESAPAKLLGRFFGWMGEASEKGASGWFNTPFQSLTAGDRHGQRNTRGGLRSPLGVGLRQTGTEDQHLSIVQGAIKAQREYSQSVVEAEKRISGYKTKLRELTEKQNDLNLLQKAGKGDTDEYRDASAKLKEEWDALYKVGSKAGGGGKGGGMNEYMAEAKRIFADTRTETEQYAEEMEKLNQIYRSGYIDLDTYTRATTKLNAEMLKGGLAATRTQADAIVAMHSGATGTSQLGDAGIKYGGAANEMASNRWEEHVKVLDAVREKYDWLKDSVSDFSRTASDAIVNFTMGAKTSVSDMVRSIVADISKMLLNKMVMEPIMGYLASGLSGVMGGLFGGAGGSMSSSGVFSYGGGSSSWLSGLSIGGARAGGGPVRPGMAYRVGERGPELFTPGTAGTIIPSQAPSQAPSFKINIKNESGAQLDSSSSSPRWDGEQWVWDAVIRRMERSGSSRKQMRELTR